MAAHDATSEPIDRGGPLPDADLTIAQVPEEEARRPPHADVPEEEARRPPQVDVPTPEPAGSEGLYEVEHRFVFLRSQPSLKGGSRGTMIRGMRLYGTPFHAGGAAWIKLSPQVLPPPAWLVVSEEDAYWAMVDASSTDLGLGVLLRRVADGGPAKDCARCPNGHMMHPYPSLGKFCCDLCGRDIKGSNELWGCQNCDYDRCLRCKDRHLPVDTKGLAVAAFGLSRATTWRQLRSAEDALAHAAKWGGKGLADGVMGALAPQLGHRNWRVRAAAERVIKRRLPMASKSEVQAMAFAEQAQDASAASRRRCGGLGAMLRAAASGELPSNNVAARTVLFAGCKGVVAQKGVDGPTKVAAADVWGQLGTVANFDRHILKLAKEDPDPHVRMACASGAAKAVNLEPTVRSGDVAVADSFVWQRLEKDPDDEVRSEALRAVSALNALPGVDSLSLANVEVSSPLLRALEDRSLHVRRQAAEALLSTSGPYCNHQRLLATKDWWVWQNLVRCFLADFDVQGKDWEPFIAVASFAADANTAGPDLRSCEISRTEHARKLLLGQDFARQDPRLGAYDRSGAAMATIVGMLCHRDKEVAQESFAIVSPYLKKADWAAALSALERAVNHKLRVAFREHHTGELSLSSFPRSKHRGSPPVRTLLSWLQDTCWRTRAAGVKALGSLVANEGPGEKSTAAEVAELLIKGHRRPNMRDATLAAVEVLAHLSERNTGDHAAVLAMCFEDTPAVQNAAVSALGRAAAHGGVTAAAVEVIASHIATVSEPSRVPACKAMRMVMEARSGSLLMVGLVAVVEWLSSALNAPARTDLASMLSVGTQGSIGSEGVQLLIGALKSESNVDVRQRVIDALAHGTPSSDHSARMVLRRCADTDADPRVRSTARTALEMVEWRASEAATTLQTIATGGICRGAPSGACAEPSTVKRRRADNSGDMRNLLPRRNICKRLESFASLINSHGWSHGHALWHGTPESPSEVAQRYGFMYSAPVVGDAKSSSSPWRG